MAVGKVWTTPPLLKAAREDHMYLSFIQTILRAIWSLAIFITGRRRSYYPSASANMKSVL